MSTLKVDAIRHNSATSDAITTASDGTCTAKLTSVGGAPLSHRNKLINGSMRIFQRGTSEVRSGGNDGYYNGIADRWAIRMHSSVAQTTFSRDTSNNPEGFGSNQKLVRANAGSSNAGKYFVYDTKIEGQDLQDFAKGTSSAKEFTLSFYIKTGVSGVYTCELRDLDNTRSVVKQYTVSNGNWNRYTLTFPADTSGTFDNNNGASLWVRFWLAAGSNFRSGTSQTTWASTVDANLCPGQTAQVGDNVADTWQITGVQLEVGDTATTFEHRSMGEELASCQRYFQKIDYYCQTGNAGHRHMYGENIPFKCEMRAAPSLVGNSNYNSDSGSLQIISAGDYSTYTDGCSLQYASTSQVTVQGGNSSQYHRIRGRVHLSAEL
tara:strand:- start:204 stop:1337 length:1134 start_codon:yes stop_codon:yes gene_type:complete